MEEKIKEVIDELRPFLMNDGGNIEFVKYEDNIVYVILQGACSGCPSSTATLKNGIEGLLKQMLPDVVENVEAVNG